MKPIETEAEYNEVIKRIEKLMDAEEGTEAVKELERLSILAEQYEEKNFPIE